MKKNIFADQFGVTEMTGGDRVNKGEGEGEEDEGNKKRGKSFASLMKKDNIINIT